MQFLLQLDYVQNIMIVILRNFVYGAPHEDLTALLPLSLEYQYLFAFVPSGVALPCQAQSLLYIPLAPGPLDIGAFAIWNFKIMSLYPLSSIPFTS